MSRTIARRLPDLRLLAVTLLLLTLLPLAAQAQGIERKGFYASLGLGGASQRVSVEDVGGTFSASREGGAAQIRLGGMIGRRVAIGADLFGFVPEDQVDDESTGGAFATATFFPGSTGLVLRAGIGTLRNEATSGGITVSDNVGALQLGIGYDIKVAKNKAIGLSLDILQGAKQDGVSQRLAILGAAINFY